MIRTALLLSVLLGGVAHASNVDLVTLPNRDSVQLTIYNSEDLTLVKETRSVTLQKGVNRLQFSWANTLIDPTSVEFRALQHADKIELADTVFPGQKRQHLTWNIVSEVAGEIRVEVSYFTSGLTWTMDYVALTNTDESNMDFTGHVRVFNQSGEEYENAEIRLIVGKINLVQKIAQLARQQGIPAPKPGTAGFNQLRDRAGRRAFGKAESRAMDSAKSAKKIVKEGVSEYFMFTVDGEETISNGWSKRMRALQALEMKFRTVYRMRAHQYGPRPVRFFLWQNDEAHKLGDAPLPDGRVRVFRRNANDGMSFLGEQHIRYVPMRARVEINLGTDDLVVYESRKAGSERYEFHFRVHNNREYVDGWNERTHWVDRIRNYRDKPIIFELHRVWPGDVEYKSEVETKTFDYRTIAATFTVAAADTFEYACTVVTRNGRNKKQNRVRLQ